LAGERLQDSIRDEGINKKIKDNGAATSWSYNLIYLNVNFRTTDFKTQLRNCVVHHSKQKLKQSPSNGNLVPRADYVKWKIIRKTNSCSQC